MTVNIHDSFTVRASARIAAGSRKAETVVAQQARTDTEPYVPFLTGSLNSRTRVVGNAIIYPGPYARYLYYGVKMVDAATGKGPMRFQDEYGNEYIRFRKGAVLRPTDVPLKYTTDFHKDAGPAWVERSKAQNLGKWMQVAKRAVTAYGT